MDSTDQSERGKGQLPVAPSMAPTLDTVVAPDERPVLDARIGLICVLASLLGVAGALIAGVLTRLIGLITNLAYLGQWNPTLRPPSIARLGAWSIIVPVIGAVIVGLMARYGAAAIRGHGIPEVMERVLHARSRIAPRLMFLKPLSAAIAIGTGGPFGAEGPIIATGGALGSTVGQWLHVTADERKALLAAGAAAGMSATFGSPVASVLLAIELLLFEYRARSIIPVALAAAFAAGLRPLVIGSEAPFAMPSLPMPDPTALLGYAALGVVIGVIAVFVTRITYWVEDQYEHLPIHWMWWPTVGALFVGVIGVIDPRTLGVGYGNISAALSGSLAGRTLVMLVALKFLSWVIYLGSGTSGGTLAPLFTIGGGIGLLLGYVVSHVTPGLHMDPRMAALVGMAGLFAGCSHALLTSIVFAFETTHQATGLLPLLVGCSTAYLVALLMMRGSIMTEKLVRRGTRVSTEYAADYLTQVRVEDACTRDAVTLRADMLLTEARAWLDGDEPGNVHHGFPVVDAEGHLLGFVERRDLEHPPAEPAATVASMVKAGVVYGDNTLREAADHMIHLGVGRLPVVEREDPAKLLGIISRSDLLEAHRNRIESAYVPEPPRAGPLRRRKRSETAA